MDRADISVREIESRLESELAQHAELARRHRELMQEHSEKSAHYAAEARRVEEDLKNFRAVVSRWLPPVEEPATAPPVLFPVTDAEEVGEEVPQGDMAVPEAVARTLDMAVPDSEEFEMNQLTDLVNDLFRKELTTPAHPKLVSNALRRMLADGKIYLVREGRPRHPAVYSKTPPKKEDSNNGDLQAGSE